MIYTTSIQAADDYALTLESSFRVAREIVNTGATEVEIRVVDPRDISKIQRRKARALVGEIAQWSCDDPDYIHAMLKFHYCTGEEIEYFSLADTDMTTARGYITYLIDFCIQHGVPTKKPLYAFCDDLEAMVYSFLARRRCAVHNTPSADIHHCTGSRVGMGRDREQIVHEGLVCLPLCRVCHNECHAGEVDFLKRHHLQGLPLDKWLCGRLGLNTMAS